MLTITSLSCLHLYAGWCICLSVSMRWYTSLNWLEINETTFVCWIFTTPTSLCNTNETSIDLVWKVDTNIHHLLDLGYHQLNSLFFYHLFPFTMIFTHLHIEYTKRWIDCISFGRGINKCRIFKSLILIIFMVSSLWYASIGFFIP